MLSEAARLLRSTDPAKWSRLHALGPDVAIGLHALEPRHPLQRELNRLRADVGLARLVLRSRVRTGFDVVLLMRAEEALVAFPLRDSRARVGQGALLRELKRWVHEQRASVNDWFLERLAMVPEAHERAAVFDWLEGRATAPRPIHRLARALRSLEMNELAAALHACPHDEESRALCARARLLLDHHQRGAGGPLERSLRGMPP